MGHSCQRHEYIAAASWSITIAVGASSFHEWGNSLLQAGRLPFSAAF
jgi:hypothetical protein